MRRVAAVVLAGAALLGACGDDDGDAATTTTGPEDTTTTTEAVTTTTAEATTTTAAQERDPLDAAAAFLATFFPEATATLSEFRQGDSRSGEVEVLRPREGGGTGSVASVLLLRLDEADQWQVIGAVNENVTIESVENGAEVPAGPLTVSGVGRGFEATIVVQAFDAATGAVVATGIGMGGAFAEPEPYDAELDLSGVAPGTELVLVASGGVGLESDPGEFSAIFVRVA